MAEGISDLGIGGRGWHIVFKGQWKADRLLKITPSYEPRLQREACRKQNEKTSNQLVFILSIGMNPCVLSTCGHQGQFTLFKVTIVLIHL